MNDGFVPGTTREPGKGLRLSVKDVFDVEGFATGAGNPTWLETHSNLVDKHADVVAALVSAGMSFVGKTQTDELAYSLFGSNVHWGTPDNPRALGHPPGGSSSGAAVTVASGSADVGLGTDTAGSIRVPASWCGLVGLRPTHSRVSRVGAIALAPSFDVPGLLTRDMSTLSSATAAILGGTASGDELKRFVLHDSYMPLRDTFSKTVAKLESLLPSTHRDVHPTPIDDFSAAQAAEVWAEHGASIHEYRPSFGPGVSMRFRAAYELTPDRIAAGRNGLDVFRNHILELLSDGTVLVLPSTPCPAPLIDPPPTAAFRRELLALTTIAPIVGLPAMSLPVGEIDGLPIGLSLVAAPGMDEALIVLAAALLD